MPLFPEIPSPLAEIARAPLEWDRLLALVAEYASASVTRAWFAALLPSADPAWIARQHALVAETRALLAAGLHPPLAALFDPSRSLAKSRIEGAALDADELRPLISLAGDIAAWQDLILSPQDDLRDRIPGLISLSAPLHGAQLRRLVDSLRRRMNPDGSLADDASPELRRIRRDIERQHRAIEESLRHTLRRLSEGGSTQDELITVRGERFVIPIKAEWKRRVPGVVHGASSSGQTVYLEPLETIEQNNELVRLLDEEQSEIHRIFLAMTREMAAQSPAIDAGAAILAQVDSLQARARFADAYACTTPEFRFELSSPAVIVSGAPEGSAVEGPASASPSHPGQSEGPASASPSHPGQSEGPASGPSPELYLQSARHPLLERRLRAGAGEIVPLTLSLPSNARQLIISGPNTGGKTVSLKTAGLLALMAQAGLPVPADRAIFPLFHCVLADIGDAQSIEQNLSTFSAHIVNLNRIAALANEHSLVLLDELGSATDPEEGAALAVAIAQHFLRARAWTIVSTHHTSLKVYAAQTPGVLNAAAGFDERTLAPTYQLRLGVPGVSAGINIAQRLGLTPSITADARARLSHQTEDIARFLDQLHAQLTQVSSERDRLRLREQEMARERSRLDTEGMKEWRAKVRELESQLQSLLKDFEFRMRESVRAIDDRAAQQKLSKEAERRLARLRREFSEQFNSTAVAQRTGADKGDAHAQPHLVRNIGPGDTVRLKSLGKTAVVQRPLDGDAFEVAIGPMKMRVPRADIAEVVRAAPAPVAVTPLEAARRRGNVSVSVSTSSDDLRPEINVIGQTVDQATDAVERYLDRAFLAGLPRVRIVHGTGMGVLRKALRAMLSRHPHVATVTEADQVEGGAGATIVELRQ